MFSQQVAEQTARGQRFNYSFAQGGDEEVVRRMMEEGEHKGKGEAFDGTENRGWQEGGK